MKGEQTMTEQTMRYVNVYVVERVYGGPEEGGWDYDAGDPVLSSGPWPQDDKRLADIRTALEAWVDIENEGKPAPWSVFAEPMYRVYVETHYAKAFPEETPYYS